MRVVFTLLAGLGDISQARRVLGRVNGQGVAFSRNVGMIMFLDNNAFLICLETHLDLW